MLRTFLFLPILLLLLVGCGSLEKEIDIELDTYESRLVVEAYLEPGKPYNLLLSRSTGFFSPIDLENPLESVVQQLESGAEVRIVHRGDTIDLQNQLRFDDESRQFANYVSSEFVPLHFEEPFQLLITTTNGESANASTILQTPFPIDSVVIQKQPEDTLYRVLTYYTDNPDRENFVRRILHVNNLDSIDQDFITDDRFVESPVIAFGTGYSYSSGDTLINTLYHIDQAYYDFLQSAFGALSANGNPFAQPGQIQSNISGSHQPIGIFTGLSYDRVYSVIP
jgi:hypothetical protein